MTAPAFEERQQRPARMMLVEDNHGDVLLIKRAFQGSSMPVEIRSASSGEQALSLLQEDDAAAAAPDLVLLDLNLPRMSGLEVLSAIRKDPAFSLLPVVIFSSSRAEQDVNAGYRQGANGYVAKPSTLEDFCTAARKIEAFWFSLAVMPGTGETPDAS